MGNGAWGIGLAVRCGGSLRCSTCRHWAWGMGHGAWGIGHWGGSALERLCRQTRICRHGAWGMERMLLE
jgi:hypothetical protein